jgi:hypothetical protein
MQYASTIDTIIDYTRILCIYIYIGLYGWFSRDIVGDAWTQVMPWSQRFIQTARGLQVLEKGERIDGEEGRDEGGGALHFPRLVNDNPNIFASRTADPDWRPPPAVSTPT